MVVVGTTYGSNESLDDSHTGNMSARALDLKLHLGLVYVYSHEARNLDTQNLAMHAIAVCNSLITSIQACKVCIRPLHMKTR